MDLDSKFLIYSYLDLEEMLICCDDIKLRNKLLRLYQIPTPAETIKKEYFQSFKFLLTRSSNLTTKDEELSLGSGNIRFYKILYKYKIKLLSDKHLISICMKGNLELLEYFHKTDYQITPNHLNLAVQFGHIKIVMYLISIGILATERTMNMACNYGQFEIIRYLHQIDIKVAKKALLIIKQHSKLKGYDDVRYLIKYGKYKPKDW